MIKTAIRFILFDKAKSIGAVIGTIMSVFLIGQQSGVFIFLIDAMSAMAKNNPTYIWVVDDKTTNVNALAQLDDRVGNELQSIRGISNVFPLVITPASARFRNGKSAGITLVGVKAPAYAGGPWDMSSGRKEDMLEDGAIVTDYFDKASLGDLSLGDYFEINNKQVFDAAQTKGVRVFGGGVLAFTTIERARSLANIDVNKSSAFLVALKQIDDEDVVIDRINQNIFGVRAWKSQDFAKSTILTVLKTSGIAISFGTLILFALIVGFVIIGLTLYSAAIDRIKDYGTMKAIGADNRYIRRLIITQALIISATGYLIGTSITEAFRFGIRNSGVYFNYPVWLRISFFIATLLIALAGSLFSIRRIVRLEPAQVFRG